MIETKYHRATERCEKCNSTDCVVYWTRTDGNRCEACITKDAKLSELAAMGKPQVVDSGTF